MGGNPVAKAELLGKQEPSAATELCSHAPSCSVPLQSSSQLCHRLCGAQSSTDPSKAPTACKTSTEALANSPEAFKPLQAHHKAPQGHSDQLEACSEWRRAGLERSEQVYSLSATVPHAQGEGDLTAPAQRRRQCRAAPAGDRDPPPPGRLTALSTWRE